MITVGELVKELKGYEKKYSDYNLVFWIPDGSTLCIVGSSTDKDGDLRIEIEEMDEYDVSGYYDVDTLLDVLAGHDKNTRVYLAGHGLYFSFDVNPDGSIFCEASEDDEIVGCYASAFGKYEYVPPTEPVKRGASKDAGKRGRYEYLALASLTLVIFFGLCYNVYALVVHSTRHALWENIAGVVVCAVLLVICGATLYYSREK